MTLDLEKYTTPGSKVLSGRGKGAGLREELHLAELDSAGEPISVIVPERVLSLNSSFFLGLFGASVSQLGQTGFQEHYIFQCKPIVLEDVHDGIRQALKESDPLAV